MNWSSWDRMNAIRNNRFLIRPTNRACMWYSKKRKDPEEMLALHVWPRITSTIHESVSWDCTVSTEQMFLFKRIGERSHFSRAPTQTKSSFELRVYDHAQTESQSSETIQDKGRSDFLRCIPSNTLNTSMWTWMRIKLYQTLGCKNGSKCPLL